MKIYLGSGSPRRKELLGQIGIEFEVLVSDADEKCDIGEPDKLVEELSRRKAEAVVGEVTNGSEDYLVIGADTVVALDGEILGKPGSADNARVMLGKLSGREHQVFTGVTLVKVSGEARSTVTFSECTKVHFYPMSEAEIDEYVSSGDPLDKAGAYGIQGFCARYISGIEGDYNNVVGLPIGRLYQELRKFE